MEPSAARRQLWPDVIAEEDEMGLDAGGDTLYVADTNDHAVRVFSLPDGEVTTLRVAGLCAPGLCLPG